MNVERTSFATSSPSPTIGLTDSALASVTPHTHASAPFFTSSATSAACSGLSGDDASTKTSAFEGSFTFSANTTPCASRTPLSLPSPTQMTSAYSRSARGESAAGFSGRIDHFDHAGPSGANAARTASYIGHASQSGSAGSYPGLNVEEYGPRRSGW